MGKSGRGKAKGRKPKKEKGGTTGGGGLSSAPSGGRPIEQLFAQITGSFAGGKGADPERRALDQAQELIYDAWERARKQDRIRLAEKALEISPDCADAYNLLAEEKAQSVEEARSYFEKGVQAGERALGETAFEEDIGHFWGLLETRPYMRARAGLAECLWILEEEEAAIGHYEDMLRLNPNDNQGIRHILLEHLLKRDDGEKAGRLLRQYEEDGSAEWLYGRALWLFRQEGESKKADRALSEALDQNLHVPTYLLGKKKVPKRQPEYIGWGDDSEAQAYSAGSIPLWKDTDGARGWLLRHSQKRS